MMKEIGADTRILIVEDQVIIAMDAEMLLSQQGIRHIDSAMTNDEAFAFIAAAQPDAAILDFSLGTTTSLPVARRLKELGIPFVFATGFDDETVIPKDLSQAPLIGKPYSGNELMTALKKAFAAGS